MFKDQLAESGSQKTKEDIIPGGKFRLVENGPKGYFPPGGIFRTELHFPLFKDQLVERERQKTKENTIPCGKFSLVENDLQTVEWHIHSLVYPILWSASHPGSGTEPTRVSI